MKMVWLSALLFLTPVALTACHSDGPFEEAGETVDDAVDDAGDAIEDACEDAKDAVDAEDRDC